MSTINTKGSEDTHLRAVLSVSISQVKGLREKLRCVQLLTRCCDMLRWGENGLLRPRVGLVAKGTLLGKSRRRELARPTRELRVSAEGYSRTVRVLCWA